MRKFRRKSCNSEDVELRAINFFARKMRKFAPKRKPVALETLLISGQKNEWNQQTVMLFFPLIIFVSCSRQFFLQYPLNIDRKEVMCYMCIHHHKIKCLWHLLSFILFSVSWQNIHVIISTSLGPSGEIIYFKIYFNI